ncbi:hypothetical protein BJ322DRAFT_999904 [Thelephora terrestris]|uniref:Paired domain-containing protein n=1 Tax=Thelephora terrestris TaxID=56493 RepID=A0A9P6HNT3_9AGAM|nr:hypothetical protein BJ322DRAFT_999904 [Thelephora terrestris]
MKGKPVSEDVGWIVVNMKAKGLSASEISDYTMVSVRQVYRILGRYDRTGRVVTRHEVETRGRSRKLLLSDFEAWLVHNGCDIFLDEIQRKLLEEYGLGMSLSGIWRSLRRSGYSMKKVDTSLCV